MLKAVGHDSSRTCIHIVGQIQKMLPGSIHQKMLQSPCRRQGHSNQLLADFPGFGATLRFDYDLDHNLMGAAPDPGDKLGLSEWSDPSVHVLVLVRVHAAVYKPVR